MQIVITYKIRNNLPQTFPLVPEEYFDPLEIGENYEKHGVPRFDHAREYFALLPEQLDWTELHLTETEEPRKIRSDFYDDGKVVIYQRQDNDGEEIILETHITQAKTQIIRIHKNNEVNFWQPNYIGIIEDLRDGSQKETKYYPSKEIG